VRVSPHGRPAARVETPAFLQRCTLTPPTHYPFFFPLPLYRLAHHISDPDFFSLLCRQAVPVANVGVEAVAAAAARALQRVVALVVAVVAVVAQACLLSIEPESLEEYAPFIGLTGPVIVVSTVLSGTIQGLGLMFLRPPRKPQIITPTFSHQKG
jgi:hypothetical protein